MDSTSTSTSARRRGPLLRKSRAGCRDCRLRKVKCDETKPVCSNCRRRYIHIQRCEWSTDASHNGVHNSGSATLYEFSGTSVVQGASTSTMDAHIPFLTFHPSSHPSCMTSMSRWRTLEMRLMYHYTSVVSHTMPGCEVPTDGWRRTIPQLSFESEVVLNPLLALSALHLHAHSQNDSNMAAALRWYLDRSLVNHRQALSNSGEELSEQLWLSAILLSHIYWLLAHHALPNETYELPLQAFKMIEGINVIFEQKNVILGRQGYKWFGSEDEAHEAPEAPEAKLSLAAQIQLRSIEEELTDLLDAFDVAALPDNENRIYMEARTYVAHYYRSFFSDADSKTFLLFIEFITVKCQKGYRDKLKQYDPLAMALMARMLVLLSAHGHAWWMNGKGDYEVIERDVRGIRELIPANLQWVMDWPCRVLDREIILTRDESKSGQG